MRIQMNRKPVTHGIFKFTGKLCKGAKCKYLNIRIHVNRRSTTHGLFKFTGKLF